MGVRSMIAAFQRRLRTYIGSWWLYGYAAWAGIVSIGAGALVTDVLGGGTPVELTACAIVAVLLGYFAEPFVAWFVEGDDHA